MIVLRSLVDAARGMPLTVDSKMANEMHQLVVDNGILKETIKKGEEDKAAWKFAAIVGLGYSALLMAVIIESKFFGV